MQLLLSLASEKRVQTYSERLIVFGRDCTREGSIVGGYKRFRPPSAFKHGGFSKTVLFPWEDADEFDALHRSLQDEWDSSGARQRCLYYPDMHLAEAPDPR